MKIFSVHFSDRSAQVHTSINEELLSQIPKKTVTYAAENLSDDEEIIEGDDHIVINIGTELLFSSNNL